MKKINTKNLALTGILASLVFLLGMTPLGLIPLGFINLTIVHIPVIVGSILTTTGTSVILGCTFGLASTLAAFGMSLAGQSGLAAALLAYSPLLVIIMCMFPRVMIPIVTRFVYAKMNAVFDKRARHDNREKTKTERSCAVTVAAVCGSLTNTILYLGLAGIFLAMNGEWERFAAILSVTLFIGATMEALAAALIASPIVLTLTGARATEAKKSEPDEEEKDSNTEVQSETRQVKITKVELDDTEVSNVATLPLTQKMLPVCDAEMQKKHDNCMKCLSDGIINVADSAFDDFIRGFEEQSDRVHAAMYAIMRFIEKGEYYVASKRVTYMMKNVIGANKIPEPDRETIVGMMRIIKTALADDMPKDKPTADKLDRIFSKSIEYVKAGNAFLAAQMLEMTIPIKKNAESNAAAENAPEPEAPTEPEAKEVETEEQVNEPVAEEQVEEVQTCDDNSALEQLNECAKLISEGDCDKVIEAFNSLLAKSGYSVGTRVRILRFAVNITSRCERHAETIDYLAQLLASDNTYSPSTRAYCANTLQKVILGVGQSALNAEAAKAYFMAVGCIKKGDLNLGSEMLIKLRDEIRKL